MLIIVSCLLLLFAWKAYKNYRHLKKAIKKSTLPSKAQSKKRDQWAKLTAISSLMSGVPLAFVIHLSAYAPLIIIEKFGVTAAAITVIAWVTTNIGKLPVAWVLLAFQKPKLGNLSVLVLVGVLGSMLILVLFLFIDSDIYRKDFFSALDIG